MSKAQKFLRPKFKIPEGSHAINPFFFELAKLRKIIGECDQRKLYSLAMALEKICEDIEKKRNSYQWIQPK